MVRIYLHEGQGLLRQLTDFLRQHESVRGLTVFRGITGYGQSGQMHGASLLDLSLDLPLVLEFFDEADKVVAVLAELRTLVTPGHIVSWPIEIH